MTKIMEKQILDKLNTVEKDLSFIKYFIFYKKIPKHEPKIDESKHLWEKEWEKEWEELGII